MSLPAIQLRQVTKTYGAVTAVDNLSLDIPRGEAFCLLGPNGAGKTTTINLMLGLTQPSSGEVALLGQKPDSRAARRQVGMVAQDSDFPETLTPREIIGMVRAHYPDPAPEDDLIERFGLGDIATRQTGGFSGGQRRRLALALAFAGQGDIVFLDEPTTGLDGDARRAFWQFVQDRLRAGVTLVITTHHLHEIEEIADRICLIDKGEIRLDGAVSDIRRQINRRVVRFATDATIDPAAFGEFKRNGRQVEFTSEDADALVAKLVHQGIVFEGLEVTAATLEDAIAAITVDQAAES